MSQGLEALSKLMEMLDGVSETLGSGNYVRMCAAIKTAVDAYEKDICNVRIGTKINLVSEYPFMINSTLCSMHSEDAHFLRLVAITKIDEMKMLELKKQPRLRSLMTSSWIKAFVNAMLDDKCCDNPLGYAKIRSGIVGLFYLRIGVLPYLLDRLAKKGITSRVLYPYVFGLNDNKDDEGGGAGIYHILENEPRMLRWCLGLKESDPWPDAPIPPRDASGKVLQMPITQQLIVVANSFGGDNSLINSACTCINCQGDGLPTMPQNISQRVYEKMHEHKYGAQTFRFCPIQSWMYDTPYFESQNPFIDVYDEREMFNNCTDDRRRFKIEEKWVYRTRAGTLKRLRGQN
tara:strand:- start:4078 stop:5118 length:1041 start_codon:yes stop_codon:yes gene_type:complete